jgi:hypothetical protein
MGFQEEEMVHHIFTSQINFQFFLLHKQETTFSIAEAMKIKTF